MKEMIKSEYVKGIKKFLKSHLNYKNVVIAINSRAVSIIMNDTGIIRSIEKELKDLDKNIRRLLTLYGMFHKNMVLIKVVFKENRKWVRTKEEACVLIEKNYLFAYVSEIRGKC